MILLFKKISILFFSLYIISLYIFSYMASLNIISHVLFGAFLGCTLGYVILKGDISLSIAYIFYFLMLFLALISYYWSINPSVTLTRNRSLYFLILFSFCIIFFIDDVDTIKKSLRAVFIGGLLMCIYAIFFYSPSHIINALMTGERLGGEINQENAFGVYCGITFIIGLYYAAYDGKFYHYALSLLPFILAIGSGSRKAILIIILGIVILLVNKITSKTFLRIVIGGILVFILGYIVYQLSFDVAILNRFNYLIDMFGKGNNIDSSIETRLEMIEFGWKLFKERPILGYGTDQYNVLYNNVFGIYRPSHNNYIQILVNYGMTGFLIYYGMFVYIIRNLFKHMNQDKNVSILLMSIFGMTLVSHFTTVALYDKFSYIFIAIGFAYCKLFKQSNAKQTVQAESEDFKHG